MSKAIYTGIGNIARKVPKLYVGVDGVARKVKKGYVGVNGIARLFYSGGAEPLKWETSSTPSSAIAITYGNGMFVAFTRGPYVIYSKDGTSWEKSGAITDTSGFGIDIAYGNGKFVAVGTEFISYSSDAVSWNSFSPNEHLDWTNEIIFADGKFIIAIGTTLAMPNTGVCKISTDGINWESGSVPCSTRGIAYGNGVYVAVGSNRKAAYSVDAISWRPTTIPNMDWESVTYGKGKFVTVSDDGYLAYSLNGLDWVLLSDKLTQKSTNAFWKKIYYANGLFIALNNSEIVAYSEDGTSWIEDEMPFSETWYDIVYGGGKFVAVCGAQNIAYSESRPTT